MIKKIIGLTLFLLGLAIVSFTLLESYNIFTGNDDVPQFFSEEEFNVPTEEETPEATTIEGQIKEIVGEQTKSQIRKVLPPNVIVKTLNLFAWSIFAGIAVLSGSQISKLGIGLMRKE